MAPREIYFKDIEHKGLNKFRRVRGYDQYVVSRTAIEQMAVWDDLWKKKCKTESARSNRQLSLQTRDSKKQEAVTRSEEAQKALSAFTTILQNRDPDPATSTWNALKDRRRFNEHRPEQPVASAPDAEPQFDASPYVAKEDFLSALFPFVLIRRVKRANELKNWAQAQFEVTHAKWKLQNEANAEQFADQLARYQENLVLWNERKATFDAMLSANAARIADLRARCLAKDSEAIIEWTNLVLTHSEYPDAFPHQWDLDFIGETGVMVIEYELPNTADVPTTKSVRYVQSRDAIEDFHLKDSEIEQIYDQSIYQTCLRTLAEAFAADFADAVRSITFNGWVDYIDKATGRPSRSCIMSVQTKKESFANINLDGVEPKACFRALKGVGSAKLAGMASVVPILRLNREDDRFVPARDALSSVDEVTNVAAIPWEDFEHLVREIFEKEFSSPGSEVKITRASRDRGVDAIAFDSNPIRGGKIVIQAKRYTNTVDVSAVRDLYGTVINEGANRGILVTTSHYGPDAYDFAKDKPLTLLDGGNLLSLLERHGHRARIDLAEARKVMAEQNAGN